MKSPCLWQTKAEQVFWGCQTAQCVMSFLAFVHVPGTFFPAICDLQGQAAHVPVQLYLCRLSVKSCCLSGVFPCCTLTLLRSRGVCWVPCEAAYSQNWSFDSLFIRWLYHCLLHSSTVRWCVLLLTDHFLLLLPLPGPCNSYFCSSKQLSFWKLLWILSKR